MRPPRSSRIRRASLAGVLVSMLVAGCDLRDDNDELGASADQRSTTTLTRPATRQLDAAGVLERHRSRIVRTLAADAACVRTACSAPEGLDRRARNIAAEVAPLDDALGALRSDEAKRARVATSSLRHAARELRSCLSLSAAKHDGVSDTAECREPIRNFHRAVTSLRTALAVGES